jgi:hypothetical protein
MLCLPWDRVSRIRLETLTPPTDQAVISRTGRDPLVPVVDLKDGAAVVLWQLSVSQHPARPKNRREPRQLLRELNAAFESWAAANPPRAHEPANGTER